MPYIGSFRLAHQGGRGDLLMTVVDAMEEDVPKDHLAWRLPVHLIRYKLGAENG
jgi:hypothetical protein